MSSDKEYILENIKKDHPFIENLDFYKIHEEFNKPCENQFGQDACYKGDTDRWTQTYDVKELLKNIHSNLYKIYSTLNIERDEYFDDVELKDEKICCVSLKYWLYDKIATKGLKEDEIKELFEGLRNHIKEKIEYKLLQPCKFYNLNKEEINNIKKVYALYTIFYGNNNNWSSCNSDQCKYADYFGEGLDEFISGIYKCSSKVSKDNYCNEFKHLVDLCKEENNDAGITIYVENTKSQAKTKGKHLLYVQTYENEPHYIYIKNEKLLNFVKTSYFLSNKNSTIAATSLVGSAIGLSSIFYYLYKFTPFGSSLRRGKGKNIVNIEEGTHNSLLYTSDTEQIPFQNREYKVAYHNFSDT